MSGPLGWRAAFLLEAAAMVPFVLFCALAPPINLKGMETGVPAARLPSLMPSFVSDMRMQSLSLLSN